MSGLAPNFKRFSTIKTLSLSQKTPDSSSSTLLASAPTTSSIGSSNVVGPDIVADVDVVEFDADWHLVKGFGSDNKSSLLMCGQSFKQFTFVIDDSTEIRLWYDCRVVNYYLKASIPKIAFSFTLVGRYVLKDFK